MRELRTALVVGGAGFFGRSIVAALIADGVAVTSVDRDPRGRLHGSGAESVQADLTAGDRVLARVLERPLDLVVHAAGTGSVPRSLEHPLGDLAANAETTLALLEELAGREAAPVLVHVSSAAVYGESRTTPMDEEHPLAPVSPYGISKLAAEQYVRLYARDRGLPALTVRPFSLYGPGQRKLVVHDLMLRLLEGERPLTVAGRGDVTRDLVYVEDAARAVVQLARAAPAAGEAYNLSSGRGTRLDELAAVIAGLDGNGVEIAFTGELRAGDPLHWQGDPGRAAALGATCATDLAEGLRRTYAWVRAEIASR